MPIVIVDYALPENKITKFFIYHFVKLYESKYYPEFIKTNLKALIREYGIEIEKEIPVRFGGAKIDEGNK